MILANVFYYVIFLMLVLSAQYLIALENIVFFGFGIGMGIIVWIYVIAYTLKLSVVLSELDDLTYYLRHPSKWPKMFPDMHLEAYNGLRDFVSFGWLEKKRKGD